MNGRGVAHAHDDAYSFHGLYIADTVERMS